MNYNSSQISNVYTQCVLVTFAQAGEQYYNLLCPFVPDMIKVHCNISSVVDPGNGYAILPMLDRVTEHAVQDPVSGSAANIYEVRSSVFGGAPLCVCNGFNSYNPIFTFTNNSRQMFQGSYTINVVNPVVLDNNESPLQLSSGNVMLIFEFIRYNTL